MKGSAGGKATSDFDDDVLIKEINNINNLIGLCPNHHWEFDNDARCKQLVAGLVHTQTVGGSTPPLAI